MRRPRPSLARRLTAAFIVSNAVAVCLFLLIVMYGAALIEDDAPAGPEIPILLLQNDLHLEKNGSLGLHQDASVAEFAKSHPDTWFVVHAGAQKLSFGPVPADFFARLPPRRDSLVEARYRNFGTQGSKGDAVTMEVEAADRSVVITAGGVDSRRITFPQYLTYMWHSYFLWVPVFTAIFNLVGGLVAIPIILRSVRSTARASEALDPVDVSMRLPEKGVVKELLPIVRAFNAALGRLAAAFERRRRFIADVAHELRTPLAVLNMHVDAMPDGGNKPDLQRTVYRLGQMIGQMLDAERLVLAGRAREQVNLVELARSGVADIAPLAVANGYELSLTASRDQIMVQGDRHAIARALSNLLGNAVAHGGGSGMIEVRVEANGTIDVSDQGPGVPPQAHERIFEPFHRERWDRDGCGLGLHLVNEVMQAHGGRARVLSSGPGALFRLEFVEAKHSAHVCSP